MAALKMKQCVTSLMATVPAKLQVIQKPVVYNGKVAAELIKEIYTREHLQPPRLSQWEEAKTGFIEYANMAKKGDFKQYTVRDLIKSGIVAAEIASLFFIGEIIGRGSLIGYNV